MKVNALFTFLVEYKGGTYVRQITASALSSALSGWRANVLGELAELSKTPKSQFENMNSDFVKLDGCRNVWCVTASVDGSLLLMNIVATAEGTTSEGKAI
jgi:hypothetical protein